MANRLAKASSPYLLQHKDNPVDWHEWGEEAFAEALRRDVPVLLSVGYSACHWCHVMAHESFEDPETAEVMNRLFVNVKVDREERPDVDAIYMEAVQAMTGRGGWPMTVWMTPEGQPFYTGTYFPNRDHHGMPSFSKVMTAVSDAWVNRREDVLEQSARLTEAINRDIPPADGLPHEQALQDAYESIAATFDPINGGFGEAPKFPQQPILEFLLRVHDEPWASRADAMLRTTLTEMAAGGIHDQLAGGFARYSVDNQWLVPHFEKMLYDNAQLARIYLWAGKELADPSMLDVARATLDYLLTDLRHPEGGFFSAEDADSEGVEGKFYVWTVGELASVLGEDAGEAAHFFGATPHGNFEGSNILHRPTAEPWSDRIESIRRRLLAARSERIRPGLDDKVVTSWNGLALRALAEAGAALHDPGYLAAAETSGRFLLDHLIVDDALMRSWREGKTRVRGFLEDHASLALGLFALYAATGSHEWYSAAERLTRQIPIQFADPSGGFYDNAEDASLIKRPKSLADNPLPSGNAMAAEALAVLAAYTGEAGLRDLAIGALTSVGTLIERYPAMVGHHLSVLHGLGVARELAILGPRPGPFENVYWERFRPAVVLATALEADDRVPLLEGRGQPDSTLAYVCENHVCNLPTTDPEVVRTQLSA